MGKEINGEQDISTPRRKKTFKNFADYWHYVKPLTEEQRKIIVESLTKAEQLSLEASYKQGGWEDLFRRNQCDNTLDDIKEQFNVDLLLLRSKILSGKQQLIQKAFWEYVKARFDELRWEHISYIFDGIVEVDSDEPNYVLLKLFNAAEFNDNEEDNFDQDQ